MTPQAMDKGRPSKTEDCGLSVSRDSSRHNDLADLLTHLVSNKPQLELALKLTYAAVAKDSREAAEAVGHEIRSHTS